MSILRIIPGTGFLADLAERMTITDQLMREGTRIIVKQHEGGIDRIRVCTPYALGGMTFDVGTVVTCAEAEFVDSDPGKVFLAVGSPGPAILTAFNPLPPPELLEKQPITEPGAARLDGIGERFEASPDMLKLTRRQVLDRFGVSRWEKGWEISGLYPTVLATAEFIEAAFLASRLQVLPVHIQKIFRRLFGWRKTK